MNDQPELEINDESKLESVESYKFEPIKGYPMLNWKGKRPFTSTQYYPAQLKENHGEPIDGWMNRIYWGDNLQVMSHLLKQFRGKIDLVYVDPPFASDENYKRKIQTRGPKSTKKKIPVERSAFMEKQYSDIWVNDEYLQFIYERLVLIKELLSEKGVIYIHCDERVSSYIRIIMDEIFGSGQFINEIIWYYTNKYGSNSSAFDGFHNNLFLYKKGTGFTYNSWKIPVKEVREQPLRKWNKELGINEWLRDENGNYLYQESTEKEVGDVWEIPVINPMAKERTGYPTQKPEALLERVISCSSNPGDLVFDCFMGSGTTQSCAMRLGRRFLGADINLGSIQTATKRLIKDGGRSQGKIEEHPIFRGFSVYNVNNYDLFRNPDQAKDILTEALELQPLPKTGLYDGEKDGRMVKIMPVNRITTKADLNPLITGFDYKAFQKKQETAPNKPVESLLLVCMGHEPDLAAHLKRECHGFELDVEVVDILRDKANLEFKRDSEAEIVVEDGKLTITAFYPMNLLQKLSLQKEKVEDWRELTESVMIDWNYDGGVFEPTVVDVPEKDEMVSGEYEVPKDAGTIRVKITDLLSESLEMEVRDGKS